MDSRTWLIVIGVASAAMAGLLALSFIAWRRRFVLLRALAVVALVAASVGVLLQAATIFVNVPAPVASSASAYFVADNRLTALEARTGAVRWQRSFEPDTIVASFAVSSATFVLADGLLLVPTRNHDTSEFTLHALRVVDGAPIWTYHGGQGSILEQPVVTTATIYLLVRTSFALASTAVVAVRAATGEELWRTSIAVVTYPRERALTADNMGVYVGSDAGGVTALRATDGTVRWQMQWRTGTLFPVADAGIVYALGSEGGVAVFRSSDGQLLWQHVNDPLHPNNLLQGGDLVTAEGVGYFTGSSTGPDGHSAAVVYAFDNLTGMVRWGYSADGFYPGISSIGDGAIYASGAHDLRALRASDGRLLWRYATNDLGVFGRVVQLGSVVFVATEDNTHYFGCGSGGCQRANYVYALSARDGSAYWRTPTRVLGVATSQVYVSP